MDKFRDAYREASKELPRMSLSAKEVQDELHHARMRRQRRKVLMAKGCVAATVFLLCGVGTIAAKSYRDSVISMRENGFAVTRSGEGDGPSVDDDLLSGAGEMGKLRDIASNFSLGGVFPIADTIPDPQVIDIEEESVEYDSLEAFLAAEETVIAIPVKSLFEREFASERVCVFGGGEDIYMDLRNEDSWFSLHQTDNRQYESYSSATAFMGQNCNERNFTNSQGLNYKVFDIVDQSGELESVHAVISVNGRDLTVSFGGFEENEIQRILNSLDLTVYFME